MLEYSESRASRERPPIGDLAHALDGDARIYGLAGKVLFQKYVSGGNGGALLGVAGEQEAGGDDGCADEQFAAFLPA